MKFITWDVAILAACGLLLAYSFLIRKHKALATLVSIYIAYVMTTVWGQRVVEFFAGDRVLLNQVWIKANSSPFTIQTMMLILITFLLSSFIKLGGKRSRYNLAEVIVYSVSTIALGVMFILTFTTPEMRDQILAGSKIVPVIYNFREWVLGVPVLAMIFFGIYSDDE